MNRLVLACLLLGLCGGCARSAQEEPAPLRVNQRSLEARASFLASPGEPVTEKEAPDAVEQSSPSRSGETPESSESSQASEPTALAPDESTGMIRKAPSPEDSGGRVQVRRAPDQEQTEKVPGKVPTPSLDGAGMRDNRRARFAHRARERARP
jgi:hypothetical protein